MADAQFNVQQLSNLLWSLAIAELCDRDMWDRCLEQVRGGEEALAGLGLWGGRAGAGGCATARCGTAAWSRCVGGGEGERGECLGQWMASVFKLCLNCTWVVRPVRHTVTRTPQRV